MINSDTTAAHIFRAARALPESSAILVLGATDTGKTTFAHELARTLCTGPAPVATALVDGDVGQSELTVPCEAAVLFAGAGKWPAHLRDARPLARVFIGSTTPAGHVAEWIVAIATLARRAAAMGAGRIVIDTPGYISGAAPRAMLAGMLDLVRPAMIVAISRGAEIDPLLGLLAHTEPPPVVARLTASPEIVPRSRNVRAARAAARFAAHFRGAQTHALSFDQVAMLGTHLASGDTQPAHMRKFIGDCLGAECVYAQRLPDGRMHAVLAHAARPKSMAALDGQFGARQVVTTTLESYRGLVCGLFDRKREYLDMGRIEEIDFAAARVLVTTPVAHPAGIAQVRFGSIQIAPGGKVLGSVMRDSI